MRPTPRLLLLLAGGLPVALAPGLIAPGLYRVWLVALGALALAALVDAGLSPRRKRLRVAADVPPQLYVGEPDPLALTLSAPGWPWPLRVNVRVDLPALLAPQSPQAVQVPGRAEFALVPRRRGRAPLGDVTLTWRGPLGLLERVADHPLDRAPPIVPDVRAVRRAALRLSMNREFLAGLKTSRNVGDGSEFDQLREFVPGLDPRHMEWRASARHRKLLCREHRDERNHQIILAFDTGHLMGEPVDGIPKLDHAINASLLLAFYSLKAGDRVGMFGFDDGVRLQVDPTGGVAAFERLQRHTADLAYGEAETNFTLGLTHLATRLRRRSLVVVLTDFVDTTTALLMQENLQRLARRHVVVFVSIRDPGLLAHLRAQPRGALDLHRAVVAQDLLAERERVIRTLGRAGIFCIDAPPHAISADLLNRHLDIKRRELI
jgi:uncharacterized protein (DUF58 family)